MKKNFYTGPKTKKAKENSPVSERIKIALEEAPNEPRRIKVSPEALVDMLDENTFIWAMDMMSTMKFRGVEIEEAFDLEGDFELEYESRYSRKDGWFTSRDLEDLKEELGRIGHWGIEK